MATAKSVDGSSKQLSPDVILADDNSRFNLKRARIDSLKASILEAGGVQVPIEVEPLESAAEGKEYRLTAGFYRYQAVSELNKDGAGLLLPVVVRVVPDQLTRLKRQLTENMERENQSPMDQAVAIKKLMDAGVERKEIRRIFARPIGAKGNTWGPASNAWVNITLKLLELPKAVQEKVHDGRIGFKGAYELGKAPADKRAAIIKRIEEEVAKQQADEEKDEERYLTAESKLAEAISKESTTAKELADTRELIAQAEAQVKAKTLAFREVQAETDPADADGKKVAAERLKAAENDVKAAQKLAKDAKNKLAKLMDKAKTAAETTKENRAKLEGLKKAKPVAKPIGKDDVARAAKAEGVVDAGFVALNLGDIRQTVKDLASGKEGAGPKVQAIMQAIKDCFDGKDTPKELALNLGMLTGEVKKPAGAVAKPAAAATVQ